MPPRLPPTGRLLSELTRTSSASTRTVLGYRATLKHNNLALSRVSHLSSTPCSSSSSSSNAPKEPASSGRLGEVLQSDPHTRALLGVKESEVKPSFISGLLKSMKSKAVDAEQPAAGQKRAPPPSALVLTQTDVSDEDEDHGHGHSHGAHSHSHGEGHGHSHGAHSHSHGEGHGHSHDGEHGHSHAAATGVPGEEEEEEMVDMWNEDAPAGREWGGPRGLEPTRYKGEWEKNGRVSDF